MLEPSQQPFRWPDGVRAALSLTFDDARFSQADVALPVLDRHGVKGSFYILADLAEQRLEAWRQALADGHEIANHSLRHPCSGNFKWSRDAALEDYTLARMEAELLEANDRIEQLLGVRPTTFAYPCGQTFVGRGEQVQSYVPVVARHFQVGRHAFDEVANDPAFCDLARITSITADGRSLRELEALIEGAVAEGAWLTLFAHEVGDAETPQAMSRAVLESLCRLCTDPARGIWVDTVAAIGQYLFEQRSNTGSEPCTS